MRLTMKHRARMSWHDVEGFHDNVMCDIVHTIETYPDREGLVDLHPKTVGLSWEAVKETPQKPSVARSVTYLEFKGICPENTFARASDTGKVCNITFKEAQLYAKRTGQRLPDEHELAYIHSVENEPQLFEWSSSLEQDRVIVRGGSWYVNPRYVRVSYRFRIEPEFRCHNFGLRCVGDAK